MGRLGGHVSKHIWEGGGGGGETLVVSVPLWNLTVYVHVTLFHQAAQLGELGRAASFAHRDGGKACELLLRA